MNGLPALPALALAGALALPAHAAPQDSPHDGQRPAPTRPAPRQVAAPGVTRGPVLLDQRYRHDHYYPAAGFRIAALPAGSVSVGWRDGSWFFHGGVWFRPVGTRFVVAVPPVGIVAPVLPPAFVPVWIAGVPYYYANGVYYAAVPQGYAVVAPPPGAAVAQGVPLPPAFVVYPRNGQSAAQSEADRAACNGWAGSQAGATDPSVFQRAFEACMDGRGYTLR